MYKRTLQELYDFVNAMYHQTYKEFGTKAHKKFLASLTDEQRDYVQTMQLNFIQDLDLTVFEIGVMLGKED